MHGWWWIGNDDNSGWLRGRSAVVGLDYVLEMKRVEYDNT